ncbi:hypothetical protein [Catenisphaera adipataccumulans]|jgi:hypothetical protein|uniref:Uncharacterized protein n=1 Tax=Catenisphaera adipataccumulans TaxID=700500 RepID=A0A7W8FWP6_9FIRM|nr:hypothetical protein [Catenisphaera adipataccumulans]MBB5182152.1 hypothetical protein [Catenisphaera adipataccumulans]
MDEYIQLKAASYGYRIILVILDVWILYSCWHAITGETKLDMVPVFLTAAAVFIPELIKRHIKRRMISGDDEYYGSEPNEIILIVFSLAAAIVLVLVGILFNR